MARNRDRIFALVLAGVFFVTSFGLSFLVIWEVVNNKDEAQTDNQPTADAQEDPTTRLNGTKLPDFTPVTEVGKLQIIDTKVGTGQAVKANDQLEVDYSGAVAATGLIFDSSLDNGEHSILWLGGLIEGWQEGLLGMKVGGQRRLLIPADKGYGAKAQAGIPANSNLVFDIMLYAIPKE